METPKKKNGAEVDEILDELKGKQAPGVRADTAALNDILTGMGMEELPPSKKPGQAAKPGAKTVPAQKPSPSPAGQNPPRQEGGKQPPLNRPATQKMAPTSSEDTLFPPPKPKDKRATTRTLPDFGTTIELDGPRLGKAAALEKVERNKFSDDEELLGWFSNPEGNLSPREARRAQKAQKKQQAADAREQKRQAKSGNTQPVPEPEPETDGPVDWSGIAPKEAAAGASQPESRSVSGRTAANEADAHPGASAAVQTAPTPPKATAAASSAKATAPKAGTPEAVKPQVPGAAAPQASATTAQAAKPGSGHPGAPAAQQPHRPAQGHSPAPLPPAAQGAAPQGTRPRPSGQSPARSAQSPQPPSNGMRASSGLSQPSVVPQPQETPTGRPSVAPRPQGTASGQAAPQQVARAQQSGTSASSGGPLGHPTAGSGGQAPQAGTKPRPVIPVEALATRNVPAAPKVQITGKPVGQSAGRPGTSVAGQAAPGSARPGQQPPVKSAPAVGVQQPGRPTQSPQTPSNGVRASSGVQPSTAPQPLETVPGRQTPRAPVSGVAQPSAQPAPKAAPSVAGKGPQAKAAQPTPGIPRQAPPVMGAPSKSPGGNARPTPPVAKEEVPGEGDYVESKGSTIEINIEKITKLRREQAEAPAREEGEDTQTYAIDEHEATRVPTAAHTKEFDGDGMPIPEANKNLFIDEMVDERFHDFFGSTVIVEREELEEAMKRKPSRRKAKRSRTALITGEFARLAEQAEAEDDEEFEDYNRPQDAEAVEQDIRLLRANLTRRTIISGVMALWLIYMSLGFAAVLPLPGPLDPALSGPLLFCVIYVIVLAAGIILNFTTVATGLVGLVGEPTVDSSSALAGVAALLQAVVMIVQLLTGQAVAGTLFGGAAVLLLAFNALGKRVRSTAILENFRIASAGLDHSAAYVLDGGHDVAYNITSGLEEEEPSILISRPTALVKGFLRQSFSQRWSDRVGRILGWVLLVVAVLAGVLCYFQTKDLMLAISALAGTFAIAAPLSSTLLAAMPSLLLQRGTTKVGAVVPGWSAIEELGKVNVVMATAKDIFPAGSVHLRGIKTFEKERVDLAILYAASVLVEGCDTLRDVFLAVIQNKSEMLYKVENMLAEPGRGFSAWVEHNRVVIGTREMLQKHGIDPPSLELEMKFVPEGHLPVYLAVSGRLFAMFILRYTPDIEVQDTLDGLVRSGVSLLVTSEDMNVTGELIQQVYGLPEGVIKVLGKRELDLLEPLQGYLPESDGVMTHIGSFASFIGGMRAAAGAAAAERMSTAVQIAAAALACVLSLLLAYSGSLASLAISIVILYQLGWSVLVSALPFARRY